MKVIKQFLQESIDVSQDEKITYHQGTLDDFINIAKEAWLNNENYHQSIENFPHPTKPTEKDYINLCNKIKSSDKAKVFIAKKGDDWIGACAAFIMNSTDYGFIWDLYIKPKYRKHDVGSNLLQKVLKWLKKNGANAIEVYAQGGNEKVLAFYKKNGFSIKTYVLRHIQSRPRNKHAGE